MTQREQRTSRQVHELRRRIGGLLWLRAAVVGAAVFCFAWGIAVLVARAAWQADREPLLLLSVGLIAVALGAWWVARRQMPQPAVLRAIVDRRNDAGGLIMAADETDIGDWSRVLADPQTPRVRWRGGRGATALLAGVAFLVTAFALPDSVASLTEQRKLDVDQPVAELQQQIETLEEEQIITGDEAAELEDKLEQIKQDASGTDPNKTWAQLDAIQSLIDKTTEEAVEQTVQVAGRLAELEELADAIDSALDEMAEAGELDPNSAGATDGEFEPVDPQDLADAMAELGEMVEAAKLDNENFQKLLDKDTADALAKLGALDPQALKELAEMDKQTLEKLAEIAKKLEEIEADSLVKVNVAGDVTVFDPDEKTGFADLKKGDKPRDNMAVRWTSEAVFREDPTVLMTVDLSAMGEGERIIAMKDNKELAIYKLDPAATPDLTRLGAPDDEAVLVVGTNGTVKKYVYDATESAQCQAGACDPDKVFRMTGQAAKRGAEQMKEALDRLEAAGMLTPGQCQAAKAACNKPGRGGISRGRGDAPMTWKDESDQTGAKFQAKTLPPATLEAIRNSQLVGVSTGSPELTEGDGSSTGGALSNAATGGGSAQRQQVLPQHRGAVQRYFDRD